MKTNALLKVSSAPLSVKGGNSSKKQGNTAIQNFNQTVNDLWEMYQSQLQRNVELMTVIQQQQQYIQSFIGKHPQVVTQPETAVQVIEPVAEEVAEPAIVPFKALTMDQVNKYTTYFKALYQNRVRRLDAIQNIIRLLHTLYYLGGTAYPEVLFEKAGMVASTGNRHISFLHHQGFVSGRGTCNHDHQYQLTKTGRLFLQGKFNNESLLLLDKKAMPAESLID